MVKCNAFGSADDTGVDSAMTLMTAPLIADHAFSAADVPNRTSAISRHAGVVFANEPTRSDFLEGAVLQHWESKSFIK